MVRLWQKRYIHTHTVCVVPECTKEKPWKMQKPNKKILGCLDEKQWHPIAHAYRLCHIQEKWVAAGKWSRISRVVTSSERKFSLCVFFIVYENNFFILEKCNGECRKTILTYELDKTQKKSSKSRWVWKLISKNQIPEQKWHKKRIKHQMWHFLKEISD